MDIGVNSNRPNFGMVIIRPSANGVIKKQTGKMGEKAFNKFWAEIGELCERQRNNPNNTIIRKAKHRNALVAEVVDSAGEIKNYRTSQKFFHRNGSLRFLRRAEKEADRLNRTNEELAKFNDIEENVFNQSVIDTSETFEVNG